MPEPEVTLENYALQPPPPRKAITINGRDFTLSEWLDLVEVQPRERITEHAVRLAESLNVTCIIHRGPPRSARGRRLARRLDLETFVADLTKTVR